ncbi:hypothetical protein Tco_1252327 [Tanacetum coccineum]
MLVFLRVENVFETDNAKNNDTINATKKIVGEVDLLEFLDSRGGSLVTNVPQLDVEDLTSWKDRFLVYLDGLEPFLLEILENGPFVPNLLHPHLKTFYLNLKSTGLVKETYTRLRILLNELENKDVKSAQAEVNATFFNSLPKKRLSMNQTQRAKNSIKNDNLATLFGKYNYEEELIDQMYESKTKRFTIQISTSKPLISNTYVHDSDSDVEDDTRRSNEF